MLNLLSNELAQMEWIVSWVSLILLALFSILLIAIATQCCYCSCCCCYYWCVYTCQYVIWSFPCDCWQKRWMISVLELLLPAKILIQFRWYVRRFSDFCFAFSFALLRTICQKWSGEKRFNWNAWSAWHFVKCRVKINIRLKLYGQRTTTTATRAIQCDCYVQVLLCDFVPQQASLQNHFACIDVCATFTYVAKSGTRTRI